MGAARAYDLQFSAAGVVELLFLGLGQIVLADAASGGLRFQFLQELLEVRARPQRVQIGVRPQGGQVTKAGSDGSSQGVHSPLGRGLALSGGHSRARLGGEGGEQGVAAGQVVVILRGQRWQARHDSNGLPEGGHSFGGSAPLTVEGAENEQAGGQLALVDRNGRVGVGEFLPDRCRFSVGRQRLGRLPLAL